MKKRLFGNISDLELTGSNSVGTVWRLTLWTKEANAWQFWTAEHLFNGYNKKEIFKILKADIVEQIRIYCGLESR